MRINVEGLGYREIYRLGDFMKRVADKGIENDVVDVFSYDFYDDEPYLITEKNVIITDEEVE